MLIWAGTFSMFIYLVDSTKAIDKELSSAHLRLLGHCITNPGLASDALGILLKTIKQKGATSDLLGGCSGCYMGMGQNPGTVREPQKTGKWMDVHPPKNGINRYWSIPILPLDPHGPDLAVRILRRKGHQKRPGETAWKLRPGPS